MMECQHELSSIDLQSQSGEGSSAIFETCIKCGETFLSLLKLSGDLSIRKYFRLTPLERT